MKKIFHPEDWAEPAKAQSSQPKTDTDIDIVTARIEAAGTDITGDYATWRDLGFALSEELREAGREYYHRISRFYPGYTREETDQQYDKCLHSHGTGITIKTFYQAAKSAGISISVPSVSSVLSLSSPAASEKTEESEKSEGAESPLPTFSRQVRDLLPDLLKAVVDRSDNEQDGDILLLGAITAISACIPNVYGIYKKRHVWANLYLFVTANASSGKGRLTLCKSIIQPIHDQLRDKNTAEMELYKLKMQEYTASRKKATTPKPEEPPLRLLFLPANASSTAFCQVLDENGGRGIMFETEGDTLANTFSSDYGDYSDSFRKFPHHEEVSYVRRKDHEYVCIKHPCVSCVLSGTPRQVLSLIPNAENGLFSRFIFYHMTAGSEWEDVFADDEGDGDEAYFETLGARFFDFYKVLTPVESIRFHLTEAQKEAFNQWFKYIHDTYPQMLGEDFKASVRRLGLITFRMMMVLSTVRMMDNAAIGLDLYCLDEDFHIAMTISKAMLAHSAYIYNVLPKTPVTSPNPAGQKTLRRQMFLDNLPSEFDRPTYLKVAQYVGIPNSTAERTISTWVAEGNLQRIDQGHYRKK